MKIIKNKLKSGQALVMLLVFVTVASVITSALVMIMIAGTEATTDFENGNYALSIAESGAENAILKILRNPNYTGEILTIGSGTDTITVSGASVKTIISAAKIGNYVRKIQVIGTFTNNKYSVSSWSEIN